MPAGPYQNECSPLPPPGFAGDSSTLRRVQLIGLLEKVIEKCQREPQFVDQQPQHTDLLVSVAQFTLLSPPVSPGDKRDFVNNIVTIGQNLLVDQNHQANVGMTSPVDSNSSPSETKEVTIPLLAPATSKNDDDFSLDDLANEYLQNDPSPPSSAEKLTSPSESSEPDPTLEQPSAAPSLVTPGFNILSKLIPVPLSNEPLTKTTALDSILFSEFVSSHNDEECMLKTQSSPLGQMLCTKAAEPSTQVQKRVSTCLLDRSLYEKLARLIILLPKQCMRPIVQPTSMRSHGQQFRPPRPHADHRRPPHHSSFQQNAMQIYPHQRPRFHPQGNYPDQQGNANNGHFVDRRGPPPSAQYQQRHPVAPPPPQPHGYLPFGNEHLQRGPAPPRPPPHASGEPPQQQKKKNPSHNPTPRPRGPNRGGGGGGKHPALPSTANKPNNSSK